MSSVSPASSVSRASERGSVEWIGGEGCLSTVVEQLRLAGASASELTGVVHGFLHAYQLYAGGTEDTRLVSAGSSSDVSGGSLDKPSRGYVKPGFCYLKAVRPSHAYSVRKLVGPMPSFARIAELPANVFRSPADLEALRVLPKSEGVYHLARGFSGDTFLDVMKNQARGFVAPVSGLQTLRAKLASDIDVYPELQCRYSFAESLGAGDRVWKDEVGKSGKVQVLLGPCRKNPELLEHRVTWLKEVLEAAPKSYDCLRMTGKDWGYLSSAGGFTESDAAELHVLLTSAGAKSGRTAWGVRGYDFSESEFAAD